MLCTKNGDNQRDSDQVAEFGEAGLQLQLNSNSISYQFLLILKSCSCAALPFFKTILVFRVSSAFDIIIELIKKETSLRQDLNNMIVHL